MSIGSKSLLVGAHQFILHPILVWIAWIKIYGWTWSIPTIASFFVHDLGYAGKVGMDCAEGKQHPTLGAGVLGWLFGDNWYWFSLLHSRSYAKSCRLPHSKLCVADKLAFCVHPKWLYVRQVIWSGEVYEYLRNSYKKNLLTKEGRLISFPQDQFKQTIYFSYAAFLNNSILTATERWYDAIYCDTMQWVMANSDYVPTKEENEKIKIYE